MATTITSIHKANDSNGFNVSFQVDYELGSQHAVFHIMHSSPGHVRTTEFDVPLAELVSVRDTINQIVDESVDSPLWCPECKGSGELSDASGAYSCDACDGKGMRK